MRQTFLYILIVILSCLIALRFINLDKIPIFIDEQTHLEKGLYVTDDINNLFATVNERLFPVVLWVLGITQNLLSESINPLLLGRATMALADILSAVFIYLIGKELFSKKTGLTASVIYLALPLNFFHSRVVLLESLTQTFFLFALYVFCRVLFGKKSNSKETHLLHIITITFLLLLSFLSKPTAVVSFGAFPAIGAFSIFKQPLRAKKFYRLVKSAIIILVLFLLISVPFVVITWSKFSELFILDNPKLLLYIFKKNIWLTWWWLKAYLTYSILVALVASLAFSIYKKSTKSLLLFCWLLSIVFLINLFSLYFFPRHLFPLAGPVALILAFFIIELPGKKSSLIPIVLIVLFVSAPVKRNIEIVFKPEAANIALEDKQQFFEDWTSGVGVKSIADDLKKLSENKKIVALVEQDGGFGWSLRHIYDSGNTSFIESHVNEKVIQDLNLLSLDYQGIYLVLNRNQDPPDDWPITLVSAHPKFGGNRYIKIYEYSQNRRI